MGGLSQSLSKLYIRMEAYRGCSKSFGFLSTFADDELLSSHASAFLYVTQQVKDFHLQLFKVL